VTTHREVIVQRLDSLVAGAHDRVARPQVGARRLGVPARDEARDERKAGAVLVAAELLKLDRSTPRMMMDGRDFEV
jgi:hypothetical protein